MQLSETSQIGKIEILRDGEFNSLGLLSHKSDKILVTLYDLDFLDQLVENPHINCVITNAKIAPSIPERLAIAVSEDPKTAFYKIHHYLLTKTNFYWQDFDSEISPEAIIHERAYVAPKNVRIGAGSIVEPNAVILERSLIGKNVIIRSGAVIGAEGFEPKYVEGKHTIIPHAGGVLLDDEVEIQANSHIARSVFGSFTEVGKGTKIDALVHIAHNVLIGTSCEIAAGAVIAGSTTIGDNVWIGPNATISSELQIGNNAFIGLGSIVTKDVTDFAVVAGVSARFLEYSVSSAANQSAQFIDLSQLKSIIANAIRCQPEEITETLNSGNCMAWDSLAKMSIAASLYDRLNIRISAEKIFKLDSLKSIKQVIDLNIDRQQSNLSDHSLDSISNPAPEIEIPSNPELLPLCDREKVTQALARRFQELSNKGDKKIVIAATFTAQPLGSPLELWCQAFNLPFTVEFGEYNQLEQMLLATDSIFANNASGLNIILTRPEDLISEGDQDGMIRSRQLLEAISSYAQNRKNLIVSNLPPVVSSFFHGKQQQVDKLRFWWQEQLEKVQGIHILDLANAIEQVGRNKAQDPSLEAIARTAYSQLVYQELGIEIARLVRSIFLPAKKVLALDCDGILWGGVLGEDGIDGIALGNDYPGRSFRLFQEMILELKKGGVLLVIVSKNEEKDVWNVLKNHPEMVLRRTDIAGYRINWKQKSTNLRELAQELNLGLDSFVFVDDSPVERLEVETATPAVTVVPMPKEPAHYCFILSQLWCFDSSSITVEDSLRTQFMAQEQQRQELQQTTTSLQSYLASLNLTAEIRPAAERDLSRIAQLTQKTNQFNLSLIRRSLPEIQDIYQSYSILVLHLKDCFGDYGLVGAAILKQENTCLFVDTFLISCRALGRGAEEAFLCTIFDFASQMGLKTIIAPYCEGMRNEQVKTFLLKMGFAPNQSEVLEAEVMNYPQKPGHVKIQVAEISNKVTTEVR